MWTTTRFVEPEDLRHDMHINIVTFQPGGAITFPETHVMEHGLYVLEGKAVYLLNEDWVEVEAGDFMWLRAFCPQACYAGGPEQFSYLLYKDVNRHMPFIRPKAKPVELAVPPELVNELPELVHTTVSAQTERVKRTLSKTVNRLNAEDSATVRHAVNVHGSTCPKCTVRGGV